MDQRTKNPGAGDAGARRLIPSDKRDPSTKIAKQNLDLDHEAYARGPAGRRCGAWIAVKTVALVSGESSAFSAELVRAEWIGARSRHRLASLAGGLA